MVGAGDGTALSEERYAHLPRLLALEAEGSTFQYLQRNLHEHYGWSALKVLVSDVATETTFHVASNPNESGLIDPETLKSVWQNLSSLSSRQEEAITLARVIELENDASAYNWLIIDCLPANRILNGLGKYIEQFDVIELRLLACQNGLPDHACDKAESDAFLEPLGYCAVFTEAGSNPAVLHALYVRDSQRQLEIQTDRLRQQYLLDIEALSRENVVLNQGKIRQENEKAALAAERDSLLRQKAELQLDIKESISQYQKQIETLLNEQGVISNENSQKQLDAIAGLRKFVNNHVKNETTNIARQIGDFINLQKYLEEGKFANVDLEINGWPASTDFLYFLVKHLENNHYDAVVELGSGTSTLVIAKTLANLNYQTPSCRQTAFLSFDHLEAFHQQTLLRLKKIGLEDTVSLIHAPLKKFTAPDGAEYDYYDCLESLAELAKGFLDTPPRLLVIVDGPPGSLGPNARYPIGPIMQHIFNHAEVDFILDDAARPAEKDVFQRWKNDYTNAGFAIEEKIIALEKGAALLCVSNK